jgi:hypothetical protein
MSAQKSIGIGGKVVGRKLLKLPDLKNLQKLREIC